MAVDLSTRIGTVELPNPVMTASGTAGHGAELGAYFDLATLGAVVVKSLSAQPWDGNPAPRLHESAAGMLNSVGLQNPGIEAWREHALPALIASGARVVASIWGTDVVGYQRAAELLHDLPDSVVAVEVNLSCPNLHPGSGQEMFAHSPTLTREVMEATAACGRPRWAKLSPNVTDLVEIADAALRGGAAALTLVNTLKGMAIDPVTRTYRLGAGGGGLSGPAIHPVAVRAVHDCHAAFPEMPIVGVGGVTCGSDAAEMLAAGACAVQVGSATLADPHAPRKVLKDLENWCGRNGVRQVADLIGSVHANPG